MDATTYMTGAHHMPDHSYAQHHYMPNPRPATSGVVQDQPKHGFYPPANTQLACDIKPRLNKEQTDMLESEFRKQNKPNTQTKRGFAETLGVSLDKVNNWFQNRRAKNKQDIKKQAGAQSFYAVQQQQQQQQQQQAILGHVDYNPHVNTSPTFTAEDYQYMMQQGTSNEQVDSSYVQQQPDHNFGANVSFQPAPQTVSPDTHFPQYTLQHQASAPELYDSQEDFNRRTLTQEAFDAIAGSRIQEMDSYETYQNGYEDVVVTGLPVASNNGEFKEPSELYDFRPDIPPAMSSHQSSVTSSIADSNFPSTLSLTDHQVASGGSSEWSTSRSSSTAGYAQLEGQPMTTTSQWQPGMSVPVNYEALKEEFQQTAQSQEQPQQLQHSTGTWGVDALAGADLQGQFSGSNTEESVSPKQQDMRFKSPAPPSNIAARRQRAPRPAALGLASLRSASYNDYRQQISPSQPAPPMTAPGHSLRRIRSSNVVTGSVSGRVQKSLPGSAQRSPITWSFAESFNSPKALRHTSSTSQSSGSLAPPTPRSPFEFAPGEQQMSRPAIPQWPSASSQASRHPSIAESEMEGSASLYMPPASATALTFSSPPHTPMYHQTQFIQQRMGSTAITENTPPQSAPASQTTFGIGVFMPPSSQPQFYPAHQHLDCGNNVPKPQHVQQAVPSYETDFPYNPPTTQNLVEYASTFERVPVVHPVGHLIMEYPPQMQSMVQGKSESQQQKTAMASPTGQFSQFSASLPSAQGKFNQTSAELEFHAYSPTDDMKRTVPLRKPVETEPKNYTFANHTSEHFERGKKPGTGKPIPSPESLS